MKKYELFNKKIYKNIKKILADKGMEQKEVAKNLETTNANLCKKMKKLEKGTGITTSSLFDIAFALGTTVEELIK